MQTKREWLNTAKAEWPSFMIIFRNSGANLSSKKWNDEVSDEVQEYKERAQEAPTDVQKEYDLKGINPPHFEWHTPEQDYHAFDSTYNESGAHSSTTPENPERVDALKERHALTLGQHLSSLLHDENIDELHHYFQLARDASGNQSNTRGWPQYGLFLDMASDELPDTDEPSEEEVDENEAERNRVRQRALGINTKGTVVDDANEAPPARPLAEGEPSHPVVAGSEGVRMESSVPRNVTGNPGQEVHTLPKTPKTPNTGEAPKATPPMSGGAKVPSGTGQVSGESKVPGADGKPKDGSNVNTAPTGAGKPSGSSTSKK